MDVRQWEVHQLNSNAPRKRPRDVGAPAINTTTATHGYSSSHRGEHEALEEPEWKRQRHPSQSHTSVWDANVQTSLWLAQQNSLAPIASMSREETSQSSLTNESEQSFLRDEAGNPMASWSRRLEEGERGHGQEGHGGAAREVLAPADSGKFSGRAYQPTEMSATRQDPHETAAPQPRKPTNLAGFEQRCEKCSPSEALLRDTAASLSKLADSLTLGPMAEIIAQPGRDGVLHEQTPLVSELHRLIDLLHETNDLANQVLRSAPSYLPNVKKETPLQANDIQTSLESMKRRFLTDSQEVLKRQRRASIDMNSNLEGHDYQSVLPDPSPIGESPRRMSTAGVTGNDLLPPIRSQSPSHQSADGYGATLPSMKPPPTPGRQLPSPPGRSHPSPPSYSIPSPSSLMYPQSIASTSAQPPQSSLANILHPLSPTPSSSLGPSTAIQAHTAALQHEVSVKKYALQTLQGEHDKLLAALRRSQTRARALEEKQVASDLEINTLAEERVRLLTQVQELEQSIADMSKSRDEFRQAAVKGGAQYVKIVRMASQLEMMAGEERREWKRKLEENKTTIEALRQRPQNPLPTITPGEGFATISGNTGVAEDLRKENQHLRIRCTEMETALRSIRSENQRFSEALANISAAGSRISESVGSALLEPQPAAADTRPPGPAQ